MRIINLLKYRCKAEKDGFFIPKFRGEAKETHENEEISTDINKAKSVFYESFRAELNGDIVIREFSTGGKTGIAVFIDGMVRSDSINEFILKPLTKYGGENKSISDIIEINSVKRAKTYGEAFRGVLMGDTAVVVHGMGYALLCETKGFDRRSVGKPENESSIMGSKEAFSESIRTNTTLIRKIIKSERLVSEFVKVGNLTGNTCALMYMDGLANPELIECVKERLLGIDCDFVSGSGMVEQFIEDGPYRILPSILSTERPDTAALHLCQGRVAVLVDGTPFALIMPVGVTNFIKSAEDSSLRWQYGTLLRIVRFFSVIIAMLLPGVFIAISNYHRGMIPTDLLIAIAKSRENVPFPAVFEILLLELSFELIREAGVRVPGAVGNTIGIVGGLILGQAAVTAGIVSPVSIIVIAFTVIANFAIPDYSFSFGIRILRLMFIALASFLGFFGIGVGLMIAGIIACEDSFGVGLLSPTAPKTKQDANVLYNPPVWKKRFRPDELNTSEKENQPARSRKWRD